MLWNMQNFVLKTLLLFESQQNKIFMEIELHV